MQSIQSFYERMGSNFLVAAFIPSLAFVTCSMFFFSPILPNSLNEFLQSENPLLRGSIVLLLFSIIIGFTLTSLNIFIIKVFEGYILIWRIPYLRRSEKKKVALLKKKIYFTVNLIKKLEESNNPRFRSRIDHLKTVEYELKAQYQNSFPNYESQILPTEFGNLLRAAETYAGERYGIDSVPIYPRLVHVVPESFQKKFDQSQDQLSFLLNCALLSVIFAFFSLVSFGLVLIDTYPNQKIDLINNVDNNKFMLIYILGFFFGLLIAKTFQRASLVNVVIYGDLIRSVFDLFRFDLLRQLKIKLPDNSSNEARIWEDLSMFIVLGRRNCPNLEFYYDHEAESKQSS